MAITRDFRGRERGSRIKVLVTIKGFGLGGAERLIVDSLGYLDTGRFDYTFAYFLPWKNLLVPQIESAGFRVHCLGMKSPSGFPSTVRRLRRLVRTTGANVIHAHLPVSGVAARIAGRLEGVPVIYTEHNRQERYSRLTRFSNRVTYGLNSRVLAVSQEVADSIERHGLNRKTSVVALLNGVPVEAVRAEADGLNGLRGELGLQAGHLVVGTVAVFRKQKRLLDWVQVASRIAHERDDVTFLLVGDGPEFPNIRDKVKALGLEHRIRMPGLRADGRRVMGLIDIFLMTSEHEGLPIALLEAMALMKPVVATRAGGIAEVVDEGNGLLSPVGAIDDLARHVGVLLQDREMRGVLGRRGAEKIEHGFHLRDRVDAIEALYHAAREESVSITGAVQEIQVRKV